jgi:hypothetical protein
LAERLLAQHVDDGTGRCAVCTAGSQTGRLAWPCQTHMAAAAANGEGAQTLRYRWPCATQLAAAEAATEGGVGDGTKIGGGR